MARGYPFRHCKKSRLLSTTGIRVRGLVEVWKVRVGRNYVETITPEAGAMAVDAALAVC